MTISELHSKYIRETKKHPINENSKEGAYSDDYVSWLQNLAVNIDLVSKCFILLIKDKMSYNAYTIDRVFRKEEEAIEYAHTNKVGDYKIEAYDVTNVSHTKRNLPE